MRAQAEVQHRVPILGVGIDPLPLAGAADRVETWIARRSGGLRIVATPNAEMIMAAQRDRELREILRTADLVVPDGAGVVWAARHLGQPVPERVAGIDLAQELLQRASRAGHRLFLLGGRPGVAEAAAERIAQQYPGLRLAGWHHGYFTATENGAVLDQIEHTQPDLLFVCLGSPKQEKWIAAHRQRLTVPVALGLGGVLDVWAGVAQRAPLWMQRSGLEWLYRLYREPRRFTRMLSLPRFVWAILTHRAKSSIR